MSGIKYLRLKPREVAEISEENRRHPPSSQCEFRWNDDTTVDAVSAPEWVVELVAIMRSKKAYPALTRECPTCFAPPGVWCIRSGHAVENLLHDRRQFEAYEAGLL